MIRIDNTFYVHANHIAEIESYFLTLSIVLRMHNGRECRKYVTEAEIDELSNPKIVAMKQARWDEHAAKHGESMLVNTWGLSRPEPMSREDAFNSIVVRFCNDVSRQQRETGVSR